MIMLNRMAEIPKTEEILFPSSERSPSAVMVAPQSPGWEDGLHLHCVIITLRPKDPKVSPVFFWKVKLDHWESQCLQEREATGQRVGCEPPLLNPIRKQNSCVSQQTSSELLTRWQVLTKKLKWPKATQGVVQAAAAGARETDKRLVQNFRSLERTHEADRPPGQGCNSAGAGISGSWTLRSLW